MCMDLVFTTENATLRSNTFKNKRTLSDDFLQGELSDEDLQNLETKH